MGNNIADWDLDGIPGGSYRIDFFVDNGDYASSAEFIVEDDDGVTTVVRSQRFLAAGWYSLGEFNLTSGRGRVTQTDHWTGPGTKVIADALRVTYLGATEPMPAATYTVPPEVTLVIDDLGTYNPGDSGSYTGQLFNGAPGVTYAVMPFQTYTHSTLQAAKNKGIKTILHQPMQYYGLSDASAGSDVTRLYTSLSISENLQRFDNNLANVSPFVDGMNNHQGSLFSEYRAGMSAVLDDLHGRGMYFLDSRTISDSVGYDLAKQKGMLTAERDLFVDGTTVQHTKDLILQVAMQAKFQPHLNYIMICHQRPATVPGVLEVLPELESMGVTLKPLERNLHYIMETDAIPPGASLELTGTWTSTTQDMISHECHNGDALQTTSGNATAVFRPNLPKDGEYRVFCANTLAQTSVTHRDGTTTLGIVPGDMKYTWRYLGTFPFEAGTAGSVKIAPLSAVGGPTVADAVKFVWDGPLPAAAVDGWELY
jgi:polysaccharide deacetylase 2 family uncharacterized protein YibQ